MYSMLLYCSGVRSTVLIAGVTNKFIAGTLLLCQSPCFKFGPPGYFIHISITTPAASALKNYYISPPDSRWAVRQRTTQDLRTEEANWDNTSYRFSHQNQNKTVCFNRYTRTETCVRWGCWIHVALRPAPIPPLFPPVFLVSLCPPVPLVSLLIPPRVLRCPWCLLGPTVV
jgi:hypothetical protein